MLASPAFIDNSLRRMRPSRPTAVPGHHGAPLVRMWSPCRMPHGEPFDGSALPPLSRCCPAARMAPRQASTYLDHPLLARGPTVRQLLSHTSGIPDFTTPDLDDAVDADPARSWTADQALTYATDPLSLPGSPVMSYSNSNFLLLGLLIERVTGLSYAAAARRDLLPGLGEA